MKANLKIHREITPISKEDLFALKDVPLSPFDCPLHYHSEYEINLVMNTSGKRYVGDTIEPFENYDLSIIGPGLTHTWRATTFENTHVITIQFHEEIINSYLLSKSAFLPVRELLERSNRGITFNGSNYENLKLEIMALRETKGYNASLDFFRLLFHMAETEGQRMITSPGYNKSFLTINSNSRRIVKICNHIEENFRREITLYEIANLVNMSESACSHFFKKRTYRSFISYLTEKRIEEASKLLAETTISISDICYQSGFDNLSNFNRTFRKYKQQTPTEYRTQLQNVIITKI